MKKKTFVFKLFTIVLLPIVLLTAGLIYCCKASIGFSPDKVSSNLTPQAKWEVPLPSEEEQRLLEEIFSQEFLYLGGGAQCYAFVSKDQKYVLKFFKMKHLLPKMWLNYVPIPRLLDRYRFEKIDKRIERLNNLFGSYRMAFDHYREEAGLVFLHLNKTSHFHKKILLSDSVGKKYQLDLDSMEFVVQSKATLVYEHLAKLLQNQDVDGAKEAIRSVLELVATRCKKGFADKDGGISNNYGFSNGKPVHIDVGGLFKEEKLKESFYYLQEVVRVSQKIESWVEMSYPEFLFKIETELNL
jgi:hypothetical protein